MKSRLDFARKATSNTANEHFEVVALVQALPVPMDLAPLEQRFYCP
jgi:hypothetical protein